VKARFSPFEDSVAKIGAQFVLNVPRAWKPFWAHLMFLLGDIGLVEAHFGPFGD
jgi:hypothetical protein